MGRMPDLPASAHSVHSAQFYPLCPHLRPSPRPYRLPPYFTASWGTTGFLPLGGATFPFPLLCRLGGLRAWALPHSVPPPRYPSRNLAIYLILPCEFPLLPLSDSSCVHANSSFVIHSSRPSRRSIANYFMPVSTAQRCSSTLLSL